MRTNPSRRRLSGADHIDLEHDYAVCAWARHFNVSQQQLKEAVRAVGAQAGKVEAHLRARPGSPGRTAERPSGD